MPADGEKNLRIYELHRERQEGVSRMRRVLEPARRLSDADGLSAVVSS